MHSELLRQARVCVSHLSSSLGLVDLKCFQMCVGSDLLAPSAAPRAWGPDSLAPSFSPAGVPSDGPRAQRMTYKRLTPFSTTSGAYYRGDSPRELGGKSLTVSVCMCMCVLYETECIWVKGVVRKHVYAKQFAYASIIKKKKKKLLFLFYHALFLLSVSAWFSPFPIITTPCVSSEL